jgi:hypothetical protein
MIHRIHLLRFKGGRIVGWIVVGLLSATLGVAAEQVFYSLERQKELVLINFYNDEINFQEALTKYRAVLAKIKDYEAKGVPTSQAVPAISEIKEDFLAQVYSAATRKIASLEAALNQLYAAKVEADKKKEEEAARLAAEAAKKAAAVQPSVKTTPSKTAPTSSPPPPQPATVLSKGARYYTQNVSGLTAYIIEADIGSGAIKVVTDTAYGGQNCSDNCPVNSVAHYVGVNNGFAGMNGTYFCPGDYSSCASSDGSFFWKVFNSNVRFMHNANNGLAHLDPFLAVGANNKLYYFHTFREEFEGKCKEDTFCSEGTFESKYGNLQVGLGCGPALVAHGNNVLDQGRLDDKQKTVKGNRGAVGVRGNVLYLVIVANATVPDLANVLDNMNIDHAFNVDGGGSAAMYWEGSYKRGSGRNIPNAIVLVPR